MLSVDGGEAHAAADGVPHTAGESVLTEITYSARTEAPNLRFAVVPLVGLERVAEHSRIASVSRRSQDYLRRACAEWARRGGEPVVLASALTDLAASITADDQCVAEVAAALTGAGPALMLRGALTLDRQLTGHLFARSAAFSAELSRQLRRLVKAYPPTRFEELDVQTAQSFARDYLIRLELPLAVRRARTVSRRSRLPIEDLIQIGCEGLIQAVDKFDPRFGVPFGAYAYPWIKQRIARGERQADAVPLPTRLQAQRGRVHRALGNVGPDGEIADPASLAKQLDLTESMVASILRADVAPVSTDEPAGQAQAEAQIDHEAGAAEEHIRLRERREAVKFALEACSSRDRDVLAHIFGIGCSEEPVVGIAQRLGLTPARIYQIKEEALNRMRHPAIALQLVDHL